MAEGFDVKEYVGGFVTAIIGITIAIYLIPSLLGAISNATYTIGNVTYGIPLITTTIVGTIVGAGILLFIVKTFI